MFTIKGVKPEVGMEVAIAGNSMQAHTAYRFGYVIEKITPTGQITVKNKDGAVRRFGSDGWEYGRAEKWHKEWLEFNVDELKMLVRDRRIVAEAVKHLNDIVGQTHLPYAVSRDAVQERIDFIQSKLAEANEILKRRPK